MDSYPVSVEFPLAWGDMDALGHVNNVRYFRYFESARIAYFEALGMKVSLESGGAPILASTSCDFLFPLTFPDRLRAEASIVKLGTTSATMAYRVISLAQDKEAARGQGTIVWFDYETQKSIPIPADMRARIETLESKSFSASRPAPAET